MYFLVVYLQGFISVTLYFLLVCNISKQKFSKIEFWCSIFMTYVTIEIIYKFINIEIISSLLIVLSMTLFVIYKNKNFLLSFLYSIISMTLLIAIDNGVANLLIYILGVSSDSIRESVYIYCGIGIDSIVAYIISKILGNKLEKVISTIPVQLVNRFSLYFISFLCVTLIIFVFNTYLSNDMSNNMFLLLANSVLLVMDFAIVIFAIYALFKGMEYNLEVKYKQEQLTNLQVYVNSIENIHKDMRDLRHDFANILSSMHLLLENKDIEGLQKFYEKNVYPINQKSFAYSPVVNHLMNVTIPELKSVLAINLLKAIDLGINVHIEVCEEIGTLEMDIMDIVRVTGILLDNAIEECKKKPGMMLQFAVVKKKKAVKLIFINEIVDAVPISRMFDENFTTKGDGRGIGLHILRKILSKYDRVSLKTYEKAGNFTQEIVFYTET